jgi:hypothetical protein
VGGVRKDENGGVRGEKKGRRKKVMHDSTKKFFEFAPPREKEFFHTIFTS